MKLDLAVQLPSLKMLSNINLVEVTFIVIFLLCVNIHRWTLLTDKLALENCVSMQNLYS